MNTNHTMKPAFPCDWIDRDSMGNQVIREQHYGITIRDYFAAKALQGMLASCTPSYSYQSPSDATNEAYRYADAMLDTREGAP